jgi:hypothetical protein
MFTIMVIMALVTTTMTGPLLRRVYPQRVLDRELAAAQRAELGVEDAFTVLALVTDPAHGRRVAELACDLTGRERPAVVVLARLLPAQVELEVASGLGAELGQITAAGDELRVLARELEAGGARCRVVARFAADPGAELAALALATGADVVLVAEDPDAAHTDAAHTGTAAPDAGGVGPLDAVVAALAAVPETVVVRALLGGQRRGGPVLAVPDGDAGGRAALRVAAHLALRGGRVAVAGGGRRAGAAVDALLRRGVPAAAAAEQDRPDVVVLPEGGTGPVPAGALVLRVRPSAADRDDELDQVLARISPASATAPG